MNAKLISLRTGLGLYILLVGDVFTLHGADGDEFAERTGLRGDQFIAELAAQLCYSAGGRNGRFRGSVWNTVMPLVAEDAWEEQAEPGVRTWRRNLQGYEFSPYTLADLRTVVRCGNFEISVDNGDAHFSVRRSLGGDGLAILSRSPEVHQAVFSIVRATGLPIELDVSALAQYIAPDGTLTY